MKWYFALNAASITTDDLYAKCVEVAVLSALQNTDLDAHFVFDGPPCLLTDRLERLGVTVIYHRTSLSDAIAAAKPEDPSWQRIAHGAFLRMDLPLIDQQSEFVLYTDCDVLFVKQPHLDDIRPEFFAVAPEFTVGDYKNMNSGVMVMNLPNMRRVGAELDSFVRGGLPDFPAFDQGALRLFFDDRFEPLPERLNWKPYWGAKPEAEIIHYHGPKPPHVRTMLQHADAAYPQVYKDLLERDRGNYAALDSLWHAYLTRAQRF